MVGFEERDHREERIICGTEVTDHLDCAVGAGIYPVSTWADLGTIGIEHHGVKRLGRELQCVRGLPPVTETGAVIGRHRTTTEFSGGKVPLADVASSVPGT